MWHSIITSIMSDFLKYNTPIEQSQVTILMHHPYEVIKHSIENHEITC